MLDAEAAHVEELGKFGKARNVFELTKRRGTYAVILLISSLISLVFLRHRAFRFISSACMFATT